MLGVFVLVGRSKLQVQQPIRKEQPTTCRIQHQCKETYNSLQDCSESGIDSRNVLRGNKEKTNRVARELSVAAALLMPT